MAVWWSGLVRIRCLALSGEQILDGRYGCCSCQPILDLLAVVASEDPRAVGVGDRQAAGFQDRQKRLGFPFGLPSGLAAGPLFLGVFGVVRPGEVDGCHEFLQIFSGGFGQDESAQYIVQFVVGDVGGKDPGQSPEDGPVVVVDHRREHHQVGQFSCGIRLGDRWDCVGSDDGWGECSGSEVDGGCRPAGDCRGRAEHEQVDRAGESSVEGDDVVRPSEVFAVTGAELV